jgi:hypothetical protein
MTRDCGWWRARPLKAQFFSFGAICVVTALGSGHRNFPLVVWHWQSLVESTSAVRRANIAAR